MTKTCSVPSCPNLSRKLGMCQMHYKRWKKYGDVNKVGSKLQDLTGKTFGNWSVVRRSRTPKHATYWSCRCQCGVSRDVSSHSLTHGKSRSCGCQIPAAISARSHQHGHSNYGSKTSSLTYRSWMSMKTRCLNPNSNRYSRYGARGVTICKRWLLFKNFLSDMGIRPGPEYSIDRIYNDGNYEPSNCRWATRKMQANNTSRTKHRQA